MIIVVDTNIMFSGLLNTNGRIGRMLLEHRQNIDFYTSSFALTELDRHEPKLIKATGLGVSDLSLLKSVLFRQLQVVDVLAIPKPIRESAEQLTAPIDPKDAAFVALTMHLEGNLWTGDLKLYNGLKNAGFDKVITTIDFVQILHDA